MRGELRIFFTLLSFVFISSTLSQVSYLGKISQFEDGTTGLKGTMSMCFSMNKKNLYVTGQYSLTVFSYDETNGNTEFIETLRFGDDENFGLFGPSCVKVSPDDKFIYVISDHSDALSLYKRNLNDGSLELVKIFYDTDEGFDGLRGAHAFEISNDGKYIYVVAWNDEKISTFKRDIVTGYVTYLQSISRYEDGGLVWPISIKLSRDNKFAYAISKMDSEISIFEISPTSGELIFKEYYNTYNGPFGYDVLEISYDDGFLYQAGFKTLNIYSRDAQTGGLTLENAFVNDMYGVYGLNDIYSLTISPDDKNIYAITAADTSFVTFSRNLSTNVFDFVESKPFMNYKISNSGYSNTGMVCDLNYVFGASYWESGFHKTKRNQPDGELTYEKIIVEGENAIIDGLYNPRNICSDEQGNMVYVSTNANGISILKRNDTTGNLVFKKVVNNNNQNTKLFSVINKSILSKDGKYLYTMCSNSGTAAIAIFRVEQTTSDLILIDSIMQTNDGISGFDVPVDITFSPDGKFLYVVSSLNTQGICRYSYNNTTGSLQLENIFEYDNIGTHFDNISISKNGRYVLIWNTNSNNISMLARNVITGDLSFVTKISPNNIGEVPLYSLHSVDISPDCKNLYATYEDSDVLVNYSIDTVNGLLNPLQVFDYESTAIEGLRRIQNARVRTDGTFVYTSSYDNNSLGLYYRDQLDGKLFYLKDYKEFEDQFDGLDRINGICIPVDDRNLYTISSAEEAVSSFSIDLYIGPDREICMTDSILLDAGQAYVSYLWSTNETTRKIVAKEEGYYYVETTDEFGFVDYDTMYLKVYEKPDIDLGDDISACIGTPVVLNSGFEGINYWNTGSSLQTITVDNSGYYSVEITDIYNCKNSDTILVVFNELPEVDLGEDVIIGDYQDLVLSVDTIQDYKYLWYNGDKSPSIVVNSDSFTTEELKVWLEVTSDLGCVNSDTTIITLDSTKVYYLNQEIKVGPVPTYDLVNISSNYSIIKIDFVENSGKLLFSAEPNKHEYVISTQNYTRGTYYLRISLIDGFVRTFKIIKL